MGIAYKSVLESGGGGSIGIPVDNIAVTTMPTRTVYPLNCPLDLDGLTVTGSACGMTGDCTQYCTFSPTVLTTAGQQTITITLGEATTTFNVNVYAIDGIEITTPPTKTVYALDTELDLTGIVVSATLNGVSSDITKYCTFNPVDGTILPTGGTFNITASFDVYTDTTEYIVQTVAIVDFATGSDADILAMINAHYNNMIDLHDYWNIGDERTISLGAYTNTKGETQPAISGAKMVILDDTGKELATPVNGITQSAFVVGIRTGQTNQAVYGNTLLSLIVDYGDANNASVSCWRDFGIRATLNNAFYNNALPSVVKSMIKQHVNYGGAGSAGQSTKIATQDYVAIPSEKEFCGKTQRGDGTSMSNDVQFKYFITAKAIMMTAPNYTLSRTPSTYFNFNYTAVYRCMNSSYDFEFADNSTLKKDLGILPIVAI